MTAPSNQNPGPPARAILPELPAKPQSTHQEDRQIELFNDENSRLSDLELLKILLAVVEPNRDVERLAYRLLGNFGSFSRVVAAPERELIAIDGIGRRTLLQIKIVQSSAQRLLRADISNEPILGKHESVKNYLLARLGHELEEKFLAIFLNSQNRLLADEVMAVGTIDFVDLSPRTLVKRGLELRATAVILVHNHPSGKTWPTEDDLILTRKMRDGCSALGIKVHDHYIVGNGEITSLKEHGFLYARDIEPGA